MKIIEKSLSGVKIKYRPGTTDEFIMNEIFNKNEYFFNELGLGEDSVVIDIGAQIGCFTLKVAGIVERGLVYSVEPMGSNYKILKENVEINKFKNIKLFNKGMAGVNGIKKLYVSKENLGGHSISTKRSKEFKNIECITLEDFMKINSIDGVDLLKLDCEGAEYEILLNAQKYYLNKIKKIVAEYHDFKDTDNNIKNLIRFMEEAGFYIKKSKKHDAISGTVLFCKN